MFVNITSNSTDCPYFISDFPCSSALLAGVPDEMITASSEYDHFYVAKNARFSIGNRAWGALQSEVDASEPNYWIQVRLLS